MSAVLDRPAFHELDPVLYSHNIDDRAGEWRAGEVVDVYHRSPWLYYAVRDVETGEVIRRLGPDEVRKYQEF